MGYLFLRGASRLDAFSVSPFPAWLLGHAFDLQPIHQRLVHPGPLVLRTAPLKYPSPIKAVRELGSERRETVRSLSGAGVGYLRGAVLSTRGPGWTDLWCIC